MACDVDVKEMLLLQISEIEMLQSMFPNAGELILDDENAINEIQAFLDNHIDYETLSARFGFTLNIMFQDGKGSFEMVCHLPHEYPQVPPEIFLRAPMLTRSQHRLLSDALQSFIVDGLEKGELYLCSLIQWLQDNDEGYLKIEDTCGIELCKEIKTKDIKFSRMWVYSHHIYNKIKRRDILDFSKELNLTGFCMPGKPGMICIEGYNDQVEEFWHRIRRMQWKKIAMKEKENVDIADGKSVDDYRKFDGFEEKVFEPRLGRGRDAHADRGLLYQFLDEKGCSYIFQIYYGFEGRTGDESD